MRLKTYTVNSMPEGMAQIKKDMGEDALILNTKKVKTRGFFGLFTKEKLEIIAAVETEPAKHEAKPAEHMPYPKEAPDAKGHHGHAFAQVMAGRKAAQPERNGLYPEPEESSSSELMRELKNIKKMMVQVMEEDRLPQSIQLVNEKLTRQEVAPEIRSEILASLMAQAGQQDGFTSEQARAAAQRKIIHIINTHQRTHEAKNSGLICFAGPTGVGKTTTIAKIAADYLLNADKKVGLITSDTYRIAAVEQLKTYAGILNIPIKIVQSAAEVSQAVSELSSCDVILMDTAGRNYQQKQYIQELEMLLAGSRKVQTNVVLSLTSKYEDMKKMIDNFQAIEMDQLILTKKDETSSYGSILNLFHEYSIPLRYITDGQNVPDDIISVTPEFIADLLLGEDEND
ncbi:GTP-binding protein [Mesobacillus campisalis]|uniref:Flagellar biosynthesis protein FlhF n=1 Tax=Mesobacillus campisalis TaxID=1408103 RepID=A0A0M2SXV9_9BACI|nr:flagellar biosynthesis protein FlhF [Mesobacillus campisalis]KKK39008.1 GTP-binding protein [Mesobacillus campisalis]